MSEHAINARIKHKSKTTSWSLHTNGTGTGYGEAEHDIVTETSEKQQGGNTGGNERRSPFQGEKASGQATSNQGRQPLSKQPNRYLFNKTESYRLSMNKLTSMSPVPAMHSKFVLKHGGHTIHSILKKVYRYQEIDELEEEEAVNNLGLILKMGGEFTYAHSARVLDLAMDLADEIGITDPQTRKEIKYGAILKDIGEVGYYLEQESDEKLDKMAQFLSSQDMRKAGLLHDIGKIRIPPEILYKPGKLTEEEFEIMKMHPIYGEQIVYPIASLRHLCPVIRGHHERWDGKGYPDGLKGEDIPLAARIIAVADVFDALAAERPYKKGMPIEKVRNILIEGKGSHFDPDLVDAFLKVIDRRYPKVYIRKRQPKSVYAE